MGNGGTIAISYTLQPGVEDDGDAQSCRTPCSHAHHDEHLLVRVGLHVERASPDRLPALLLRFVPEALKNTYLGAMTFVGLMLAMTMQPLAGAWSDRTRSRWGRRRPWMVAGTLAGLGCLAIMAGARELGALALRVCVVAALLQYGPRRLGVDPGPDPSCEPRPGLGHQNLFDMGGLVATSLVAGQLMASDAPGVAFAIIAVVLTVSAATTILATREATSGIPHIAPGKAISLRRRIWDVIRPLPKCSSLSFPDHSWGSTWCRASRSTTFATGWGWPMRRR